MSWIQIRIFLLPEENGNRVDPDAVLRFIDQIRDDALYGTYGVLDSRYWRSRMALDPAALSEIELIGDPQPDPTGLIGYELELRLNSQLFPPAMGGAPHLFSMLAGDLLRFTLPPIKLRRWEVRDITFPDDWQATEYATFRDSNIANDIRSLRLAFKLRNGMPLLAFSFKPRVGFDIESLKEATIDVLSTGFNIVELDTRHLALDKSMLYELINLSAVVSEKFHKHVARLSLNLSLRPDLMIEAAGALCNNCAGPAVLKIDGGFNGLSSVQAIRGIKLRDGRKCGPVITCYPLMQNALPHFIPSDQYIARLAASGVDIIYPGGRPDIGSMVRSLEGSGERNSVNPVRRYKSMAQKGWPMLSVAGGIYPGQLQAFYELLGPDVAWFLGGGVALHKDGPKAGAALCVRIATAAAEMKAKAGDAWSGDISERLSEQADSMFKDRSLLSEHQLRYVSPQKHLAKIHGLVPYSV